VGEQAQQETIVRELCRRLGGSWQLVHVGDHYVFADDHRIAKVATHPDGFDRLATGVRAALAAADAGIPVVVPLCGDVLESDVGPLTVWPLLTHRRVTAEALTGPDGRRLGAALGALSTLPSEPRQWDPFYRVEYRLTMTAAPAALVAQARHLVTTLAARPVPAATVFAHGDASVPNALFADHGVLLIDLDSAGRYPAGWDLACLRRSVRAEAANPVGWRGLEEGWQAAAGAVPEHLETLEMLKATRATTFLFTLTPTPERLATIAARLGVLTRWLEDAAPTERAPGT
jgi:Ser/Thr protein kinase RdoA (MazF antagonist)